MLWRCLLLAQRVAGLDFQKMKRLFTYRTQTVYLTMAWTLTDAKRVQNEVELQKSLVYEILTKEMQLQKTATFTTIHRIMHQIMKDFRNANGQNGTSTWFHQASSQAWRTFFWKRWESLRRFGEKDNNIQELRASFHTWRSCLCFNNTNCDMMLLSLTIVGPNRFSQNYFHDRSMLRPMSLSCLFITIF